MSTITFTTASHCPSVSPGDYYLLPWLDQSTPVFDTGQLPSFLSSPSVPEKPGAYELFYLESQKKGKVAGAVCRLDKEFLPAFRQLRLAISKALTECRALKMKRLITFVDAQFEHLAFSVCEGALSAGYSFDKYCSEKVVQPKVVLVTGISQKAFSESRLKIECVNFAKDTLNEPPVAIHPVSLAEAYKIEGKRHGLKITVWDEARLSKERCGGILAVGGGSSHKPRLVIAQYGKPAAKVHLALVGKGVTFDSGGYSLKPSKSMTEMKFDMGGAAMMFGAACAIASLRLPIRLTVFLPLVHNAIGEGAYNVSDVITTRNGLSVEVQNTDAEGRIILADALALASEQDPDFLIDAATLTGAAVVALGEDISAVYGDNDNFVSSLLQASKTCGEDMWPMPLHKAYNDQLDSIIADMRNIGGPWAGSITAALFLRRFVKNPTNWIHLDIAGPGCKIDALEHLGKGAKGYGISTIVELAKLL